MADETASPRRRSPKSEEPRPITVTQRTVEAVFGMPARHYLETLRAHPEIDRRKVGKLIFVRVEDLEAWLSRVQPVAPAPQVCTITNVDVFLAAARLERRHT